MRTEGFIPKRLGYYSDKEFMDLKAKIMHRASSDSFDFSVGDDMHRVRTIKLTNSRKISKRTEKASLNL